MRCAAEVGLSEHIVSHTAAGPGRNPRLIPAIYAENHVVQIVRYALTMVRGIAQSNRRWSKHEFITRFEGWSGDNFSGGDAVRRLRSGARAGLLPGRRGGSRSAGAPGRSRWCCAGTGLCVVRRLLELGRQPARLGCRALGSGPTGLLLGAPHLGSHRGRLAFVRRSLARGAMTGRRASSGRCRSPEPNGLYGIDEAPAGG